MRAGTGNYSMRAESGGWRVAGRTATAEAPVVHAGSFSALRLPPSLRLLQPPAFLRQ